MCDFLISSETLCLFYLNYLNMKKNTQIAALTLQIEMPTLKYIEII